MNQHTPRRLREARTIAEKAANVPDLRQALVATIDALIVEHRAPPANADMKVTERAGYVLAMYEMRNWHTRQLETEAGGAIDAHNAAIAEINRLLTLPQA